jgi:isochorismate synthase
VSASGAPPADPARERLASLVSAARAQARRTKRPVLVSMTEAAPALDLVTALERSAAPDYAAPERTPAERFYWERPDEGFAIAGVGAAVTLAPTGEGRFATADRAWRALLASAMTEDASEGAPGAGPTLVGGFAFDADGPRTDRWLGFPASLLLLPRLQLTAGGGAHWLTTNLLVRADGTPDVDATVLGRLRAILLGVHPAPPAIVLATGSGEGPSEVEVPDAASWQAAVGDAAAAVRAGALEKVVLARELRARADRPFDVAAALRRLRDAYPSCHVYAVWRGARVFLGASPERLVRLEGREVAAACLAGSIGRGTTPADDERQGAALLASAKDRAEHAVVARALREGLAALCDDVRGPDEPGLLTVHNVHHLHTPLRARLREGRTLLDLVARLHPTPAVGGAPRDAALAFLRAHEALDRGWYAGPVGWMGHDGGGEFAVALRSALVRGAEASLFAGCGVMGDSDPAAEYAESALKLRAMRLALDLAPGPAAPAIPPESAA